jgi:hypothetical protein
MTAAAWTMMLVTWGIVIAATTYFLIRVLRDPHDGE